MISYAQNFEDVILARALGDRAHGFYVDVGACFPDVASVTRHFYELGWNGINVEPMDEPFERLSAERPRDINVKAAVASFTGEIPIYHGPSIGESSALRPFDTARPILVSCFTLADLCRRYVTRPIDFLKIDVEGLEHDVVKGGDWAQYRPAVVIVEVTIPWSTQRRPDAIDIGEFLCSKNYDEVYFDGLNAFFLAREAASLAPRFAAPPNVLDRFTVVREAELEAATGKFQAHAESVERRLLEMEAQASAAERDTTVQSARATAAEDFAKQSERANAELREALREKESLLLNAQRAWQDGVATALCLQAEVAKATDALQAVELRARDLAQASADAVQRAESAARDASGAMTAARAADARAQAAEARAEESEVRLQQVEGRAREAEANADAAEAKAVQDAVRARQAEIHAQQAENTIASMLRSRSWRVTAPLRAVADLLRGGPRGSPAPAARRELLIAARASVLRRARSLARRTSLYHWVAPRLKRRYPKLWMRARTIALENPAPPPIPTPTAARHATTSAGAPAPDTTVGAAAPCRMHDMPADATIAELTSWIQREIARRRA